MQDLAFVSIRSQPKASIWRLVVEISRVGLTVVAINIAYDAPQRSLSPLLEFQLSN